MMHDALAGFHAEVMRLTTQYQRYNGEPNTVELFCTDLCLYRDRYRQKLAQMVLAGDMTRADADACFTTISNMVNDEITRARNSGCVEFALQSKDEENKEAARRVFDRSSGLVKNVSRRMGMVARATIRK